LYNDWQLMVIKYCISVLHPLLYNYLKIFIFWEISKISYSYIFDILIFSKISYFPILILGVQ